MTLIGKNIHPQGNVRNLSDKLDQLNCVAETGDKPLYRRRDNRVKNVSKSGKNGKPALEPKVETNKDLKPANSRQDTFRLQ